MRSLGKGEKIVFWITSSILILVEITFFYPSLQWVEMTDDIIYLIELVLGAALSVQLILFFIEKCPLWLNISVGVIAVVYRLYSSTRDLHNYGMELIGVTSLIIMCSAAAFSCLIVIIKIKPDRKLAVATFICGVVYAILALRNIIASTSGLSERFGELIYSVYDIITILYYDIISILYNVAIVAAASLMLRIFLTGRRCECGYVYKTGARFCGGCGKMVDP